MRVVEHTISRDDVEFLAMLAKQMGHGDGILWDTVVTIDDEHVLDITVYGSEEETPWMDAVLFQKAKNDPKAYVELGSMDVGDADDVLGDYELPELGVTVRVKEAS